MCSLLLCPRALRCCLLLLRSPLSFLAFASSQLLVYDLRVRFTSHLALPFCHLFLDPLPSSHLPLTFIYLAFSFCIAHLYPVSLSFLVHFLSRSLSCRSPKGETLSFFRSLSFFIRLSLMLFQNASTDSQCAKTIFCAGTYVQPSSLFPPTSVLPSIASVSALLPHLCVFSAARLRSTSSKDFSSGSTFLSPVSRSVTLFSPPVNLYFLSFFILYFSYILCLFVSSTPSLKSIS